MTHNLTPSAVFTIPSIAYEKNAIRRISFTHQSPKPNQFIKKSYNQPQLSSWPNRVVLSARIENSVPQTTPKKKSAEKSYQERKAVRKNILRPCHKPVLGKKPQLKKEDHQTYMNSFYEQGRQLGSEITNMNDCCETAERLRQMKLSESIQPIVQPYRDKSTDSYHYGRGYGHSWDSVNESQCDKFRYPSYGRPTGSQEEEFPEGHNMYRSSKNAGIKKTQGEKIQESPLCLPYIQPEQCFWGASDQNQVIKQELQQQRESKEIFEEEEINGNLRNQSQPQTDRVFVFTLNQDQADQGQNQIETVNQSEAEKCEKIRYLYEPYSMNLSSNHKTQNNALYQSDQQTPKSFGSKNAKGAQNKVEIFDDEDKWDKILRIRQQSYQKSGSGQKSGVEDSPAGWRKVQDTAAKTGGKNIPKSGLEDLRAHTANSYQSSEKKMLSKQEGWQERPKRSEKEETEQKIGESESTSKLYNKLQQIANQYKGNRTDLNQMKYSYSFEQSQQVEFRTEKVLFSKLLSSTQLQWMLIYSQMISFAEQEYMTGTTRRFNQNQKDSPLVNFVKIGDSKENVIIAHYIGVWLLWMGYDDRSNKDRILENVELMFTDAEELMAQEQRSEDIDGSGVTSANSNNIREIAEIMYNNLFYGYLPDNLQLQAIIEICRRGWEYMTFLIYRIIRVLLKLRKRKIKKAQQGIKQQEIVDDGLIYEQLERVIQQS